MSEHKTLATPEEQPDEAEERIEGMDKNDEAFLGDYPIDTVLIRNEPRTVHDVLRRIELGSFIMDPDFQRDFIWGEDKQSKLIESVLMRIPLPVFYLAENDEGRMIVVDGLQRLSTFQRFVNNELRLKLEQDELKGKRFSDLSPKLQNRIEDCTLIVYVIDAKVPERARLDIFERVNGGVPLTRQQMRNCLFMGPATQFLKKEATRPLFIDATGRSLKDKTMRDREMINRFCAFQILPLEEYRGDMDQFLARALKAMNAMKPDQLDALSQQLRTGLTSNLSVFGRHAFRKHEDGQENRGTFNASLWDVMSTGLSRYPESVVQIHAEHLRNAFHELLTDIGFNNAISLGTNQANRVKDRFEIANKMLDEVLGAHTD